MPEIPQEARPVFDLLLAQPLEPEDELRAKVDEYVEVLRSLREDLERDIDMAQAEALADRSRRLLDSVTPMTSEEDRRLIQTAIRYFLDASDAQRDLRPGGLDDDVEVMNAVVSSLLRTDLLIHRG